MRNDTAGDDATLAAAIARYHELCADPQLAGPPVVTEFVEAQRAAGLTFGGMVQCRSLRPAFVTPARLQQLRAAVACLWQAFAQIEQRAIGDASLANELGLSAAERQLIAMDPGYADAAVVTRLDTFFGRRPVVLEYNADSPAGMSYQAGQAALMVELPVFQRFLAEYQLEPLRADIALRETLLGVWREFAARSARIQRRLGRTADGESLPLPRIAIVDLADAATSPEFRLVNKDLANHGIPSVVATPEDLSLEQGELRAFGEPVDLVYKRLLVADFLAHYDLNHPLVRAYATGSVCVASSFRCTIAHKKRALAALRDPRHAHWFTHEQRRAIEMLVPRTQPLAEWLKTADGGTDREQRKNVAVLKPNDSHGGQGIVLGWECAPKDWRDYLTRLRNDDYVVQHRVQPVHQVYPVFDAHDPGAGARLSSLVEDCNAYVFRGELGGILTRLSESAIINVSKGGQAIPTFVVTRRAAAP